MSITPEQVISNLKELSARNTTAAELLNQVQAINAFVNVPKAINELRAYLTSMSTDLLVPLNATQPLKDDAQAKAIAAAIADFAKQGESRNAAIIAKAQVIKNFALAAPVAAILRALESSADTLVFTLISYAPQQADGIKAATKNWNDGTTKAINVLSADVGVFGF